MVTVIVLLVKRRLRVGMVPGLAQMRQVAGRGLQRRHPCHFGRGIVGQNRRPPVHAGVAQPALGTGYQADRRQRAARPRKLTHGKVLPVGPGQGQVASGQFVGVRQVQKGWQQREVFDAARRRQLRNVEHAVTGLFTIAGANVHIGQARSGWCPDQSRWKNAARARGSLRS